MRYILLFYIVFLGGITTASSAEQQKTYTFGVFPYLSAVRLEPIYAPVSTEISKTLGIKVRFRTASKFKRFFLKLKKQYYDIALIQPFWYPPAVDEFSYVPLVRMQEPFVSLIMVPDTSAIKNIQDLKGKIIATPPAFVPVVHMAKRALIKIGLVPGVDVTLKAFKNVDSCFHEVIIGRAEACIAPPFAPKVIERKMNVKLRLLLKTPSIPNLSLVVHTRVPVEQREKIKHLFVSWSKTKAGLKLLKLISTKGFVPAYDSEYDVVRTFLTEIKNAKSKGK